jgi:hypothetical protein
MTDPPRTPPDITPPREVAPTAGKPPGTFIVLSAGEFYWLTFAVWLGGIFILTLMPVLLIPRLGMALGVAGSYTLFFIAWQPVQMITQRTFGMRAGIIRMVIFVAAAAVVAFYLREALLGMARS